MWLLIIVIGYPNGGHLPEYTFHDFKTKARCEQIKEWITKREQKLIRDKFVTVQCVKNQ